MDEKKTPINTDPVVDVRDEEINRLKEENDKLRKENGQLCNENTELKDDLALKTSLYKFESEQRQSLSRRIEAIKNILEI